MKKIMSLMIFLVCGFLLTGCSSKVIKSNTIKSASIELDIQAVPVAADLKISDKRASGQASGKISGKLSKEDITSQALTKALGQDPPSAEGPDVLIGINRFEEWKGKKLLKVTVTGYPAWYTNFHNAEDSDSAAWLLVSGAWGGLGGKYQGKGGGLANKTLKLPKAKGVRTHDWYFSPKYELPLSSGTVEDWAGSVNLEGGVFWDNRFFVGLDLTWGIFWSGGDNVGLGINLGSSFSVFDDSYWVYGVSGGIWRTEYMVKVKNDDWGNNKHYFDRNQYVVPFVKGRWHNVELVWKGYFWYGTDIRFLVGYNFETSKRGSK